MLEVELNATNLVGLTSIFEDWLEIAQELEYLFQKKSEVRKIEYFIF